MNRKQRREEAKRQQREDVLTQQSAYGRMMQKREAVKARLEQNGITIRDLEQEFERGYKAAQADLTRYQMQMFYCAAGIAAHDTFRFGQKRISRLLNRIQTIMTEEICTGDITERMKRETGLDVVDEGYDN